MSPPAPAQRGRPPASLPAAGGLAVVIVEGRDAGRTAALPAGGARLRAGTARESDLVLHDEEAAPAHVEMWVAPDGIGVRDLGTRTGTFVGAVRVIDAVVPPATRVRIGRTVLSVGHPPQTGDVRARLAAEGLVFASDAMGDVAESLRKLAPFAMSVLVEGETGTGKEVVARALHALSMRNNGPFVFVDCGALPPSLVESELFGHERGAFTSAEGQRAGAFEMAHGGTLFLDEIGELPRESQAALLGVLSRRRFRRVGGTREVHVDVRVVAATNRDLTEEIGAGAFRSDLYYRLATARIVLPPLRERPDDLEVLVAHFFRELSGASGAPLDEATLRALRAHPWPGNVRELRAVVERAAATGILAPDRQRRPADGRAADTRPPDTRPPDTRPPDTRPPDTGAPVTRALDKQASETGAVDDRGAGAGSDASAPRPPPPETYRDARAKALDDFERAYLEQLISACAGNASEASRVARMDRPHLLRMLRRHNLR